jgi:hypothetical protein
VSHAYYRTPSSIGRANLPNRRASETTTLTHEGITFDLSTGYYEDGGIGEAFVHARGRNINSMLANILQDAMIIVSLARQWGVPVEKMREGVLRDETGAPTTIIGRALDAIERAS